MRHLWLVLVTLAALVLGGCASVNKVESGSNTIGSRLKVHIEGNWNHVDFPALEPEKVWTMEGLSVDRLMIYSGIKDGQLMHPKYSAAGKRQDVVFRSNMTIEQLVAMFEGVYSRDDSIFTLARVEPSTFGGRRGFMFEFQLVRNSDGVRQTGFGYGAVDAGELFAVVYTAPTLTFFPRHQARVEAIAHSAVIASITGSAAPTSPLPPPVRVAIRPGAPDPARSLEAPPAQSPAPPAPVLLPAAQVEPTVSPAAKPTRPASRKTTRPPAPGAIKTP